MASVVDASGEALRRTASIPAYNAFSMCCFYKHIGLQSGYNAPILTEEDATSSPSYLTIMKIIGASGLFAMSGSGTSATASMAATVGEWYFVGMTLGSTYMTGYLKRLSTGATETMQTATPSSHTAAAWEWGNYGWDEPANGGFAKMCGWDVELTADEMWRESVSIVLRKTASVNVWVPSIGQGSGVRNIDYSGNGRNLTEVGTLTDVDGPPVGWGAPIWLPQYTVSSGIPVLSAPSMSSITATTAVPRVTLTF